MEMEEGEEEEIVWRKLPIEQNRTEQDWAGHDRTEQDETGQTKRKQDRTEHGERKE
jgi:hypothetical protein